MNTHLGNFRSLFNRVRFPGRDVRSPAITMYHAISTAGTNEWGPWQYVLTPSDFRDQILSISHTRNIVTLDSLVSYLCADSSLPENATVLTFDDGYEDFVSQALPVLREYDLPATLYVSTGLMTERATPYEFRLAKTLQQSDELKVQINDRELTYRLTTATKIREAYAELRPIVDALSPEERGLFLDRHDIVECPEFRIIGPDTIRELADEPLVTVGSHGHVHRRLGTISGPEIKREVHESRKRLADLLGGPPDHFSFPYGSHSRKVRQVVREAGFESAVTTDSRFVEPCDWNRCYTLPRFDMSDRELSDR